MRPLTRIIGADWTGSASDRAVACPASFALPQVREPSGEDADWGTAVHGYLERRGVDGHDAAGEAVLSDGELHDYCTRKIDHAAIDALTADRSPEHVRREVRAWYDPMGGLGGLASTTQYGVRMRLDLVIADPAHPVIYDYKTGDNPPRAASSMQLAIAGLALTRALGAASCTVGIVHLREDGTVYTDTHALGAEDLSAYATLFRGAWEMIELARSLVERGQPVNVVEGSHCRYCPAKLSCPAKGGAARAALAMMSREDIGAYIANMPLSEVGRLWVALDAGDAFLTAARAAVRLIASRNVVTLPDGRRLTMAQESRKSIDARKALPVLAETLGPAADAALEWNITQASIKRALGEAGLPASQLKQIMATLADAGAVTESTYEKARVLPADGKKGKAALCQKD